MATKVKTVRLRSIHSGAIVEVPEEKAARLGGEWEPADKPATTAAAKTAKAAAKPTK